MLLNSKKFKVFLFSLLFLLFGSILLPSSSDMRIVESDFNTYSYQLDTLTVTHNPLDKEKLIVGGEITREIFIKHYLESFKYISKNTGLSVAQLYTILFFETGGNNMLWRKYNNGACVKASKGRSGTTKQTDDCGSVPCIFSTYDTPELFFRDWIRILNLNRYSAAKNKTNIQCFNQLKKGGWHSDNSQHIRAKLANSIDKLISEYAAP
jgi:hypothetical protein